MLGKFVVIEGCDFTGKTTQIKKIANFFRENTIKHITTREPGGTIVGEQIRELIFENGKSINPITETMLFMASRNEHIHTKIMPMIASNITVLCDRFLASTIVYQGILRNVEIEKIDILQKIILPVKIDLTIVLDMNPDEIIARMESKTLKGFNAYDSKEIEEVKKIREGFLKFSVDFKETHNVKVVNANQEPEKVFIDIVQHIKEIFPTIQ